MKNESLVELLQRRKTFFKLFGVILTVVGTVLTGIAFKFDCPGLACFCFFVAMASFIVLERFDTYLARQEYLITSRDVLIRLDRIDFYLKASQPDKLTVALFDHLLIYLPLYVADFSGYLKEENIELIKYNTKGSDEGVAKAVWSNEADIGLCDPCMCAQKQFRRSRNELLILAPLVAKASARPVTKHDASLRATILKGGTISIATYSAPSTTFVMAVSLKEELERKSGAKILSKIDIRLVSKQMEDFHTANLTNLLDAHDLVMLWEPFLTIAERSPEVECFVLDRSLGNILPNAMYSALIISQRLLLEKPTLAIRLFRALSRATNKIQLAAENQVLRTPVLEAAQRKIAFPPNFDVDSLVQKMIREGLFPLIDRPDALYTEAAWKNQLFEALQYRKKAIKTCPGELEDNLVDIPNLESCLQFFCPPNVFTPTEIQKAAIL